MKKGLKIVLIIIAAFIVICGIAAFICISHFVGFPKAVGTEKYNYKTQVIYVEHDGIRLYGKTLVPEGEGKWPVVIYAHGAESTHSSDMTTLKSLAMSGIACVTFDFYGWSTKSTGPQRGDWFKGQERGVDDRYEKQVLEQVKDLNSVIEFAKTCDFADTDQIYLLGSSMGGATVAACSVEHSDDIKAIILQYPAINLVPTAMTPDGEYDVNQYTSAVLLLQGTADAIVPIEMSDSLVSYYNELYPDHCSYVVYEGQPHVFTGKYKVEAAREIFGFIKEQR